MRFFEGESGVYREDVLEVLASLDAVLAPLQTLCDSPRESEVNDKALEQTQATRAYIEGMLSSPQLEEGQVEPIEQPLVSPRTKM